MSGPSRLSDRPPLGGLRIRLIAGCASPLLPRFAPAPAQAGCSEIASRVRERARERAPRRSRVRAVPRAEGRLRRPELQKVATPAARLELAVPWASSAPPAWAARDAAQPWPPTGRPQCAPPVARWGTALDRREDSECSEAPSS